MDASSRHRRSALFLPLFGLLIGLITLELGVRRVGSDIRIILGLLPYQGADLPVHRISADPILHYELNPNSEYSGYNPVSQPPRKYHVSIDENGARNPPHTAAKQLNTFRILFFGGSTVYGGSVNDADTIPAALERRLNNPEGEAASERARFEVWNFGVSAFTLGQATHLARQKLTVLSPDLILVQHHNLGCWPFLMSSGKQSERQQTEQIAADPYFVLQYFPPPHLVPAPVHRAWMRSCAVYRFLIARRFEKIPCDDPVATELSANEARTLNYEAAERGVPVVYVAIPADQRRLGPGSIFPELSEDQFVDLFQPDRDADFYDVHPRADTLDQFASLLLQQLQARRLLPTAPHEQ